MLVVLVKFVPSQRTKKEGTRLLSKYVCFVFKSILVDENKFQLSSICNVACNSTVEYRFLLGS